MLHLHITVAVVSLYYIMTGTALEVPKGDLAYQQTLFV